MLDLVTVNALCRSIWVRLIISSKLENLISELLSKYTAGADNDYNTECVLFWQKHKAEYGMQN